MDLNEIIETSDSIKWLKVSGTVTGTWGSLRLYIKLDPGVLPESFSQAYGDSYEKVPQKGFVTRLFSGATRPLQAGDRVEGLVEDYSDLHQPSLPGLADARDEKSVYVRYINPLP